MGGIIGGVKKKLKSFLGSGHALSKRTLTFTTFNVLRIKGRAYKENFLVDLYLDGYLKPDGFMVLSM